jgi:tetratricopeptide (TPR) repeat protein
MSRHHYIRTFAIAVSFAVSAPTIEPGIAQADEPTDEVMMQCVGNRSPNPEERIRACTAEIGDAKISAKKRAIAYRNRGTMKYYAHDNEGALADYDKAIELDPTDAEALDNRCWTRGLVGKLEEARQDCEESLRLRPNFANTYDSLGFVLFKLGRYRDSIAAYDSVLRIEPRNAYSLYGRGMAKLRAGDTPGGQADIAAAKAIKDVATEMAGYGVKDRD